MKYEDWKKKEPPAKASPEAVKSNAERLQMERKANAAFTLSLFDPWSLKLTGISDASVFLLKLKKPLELLEIYKRMADVDFSLKEVSSITITMKKTLPISEIYQRMEKAFGDLAEKENQG